jgi:hypothetical protein
LPLVLEEFHPRIPEYGLAPDANRRIRPPAHCVWRKSHCLSVGAA